MMLTLSRKADYALVAMAELAFSSEHHTNATSLADATGVPLAVLRNILKALARHGLLQASRGPFGGYALSRPPDGITVLEIVESIQGPTQLTHCCGTTGHRKPCGLTSSCRIRRSVRRLHDQTFRVLRTTTIADLIDGEGQERGTADEPVETEPAPTV